MNFILVYGNAQHKEYQNEKDKKLIQKYKTLKSKLRKNQIFNNLKVYYSKSGLDDHNNNNLKTYPFNSNDFTLIKKQKKLTHNSYQWIFKQQAHKKITVQTIDKKISQYQKEKEKHPQFAWIFKNYSS